VTDSAADDTHRRHAPITGTTHDHDCRRRALGAAERHLRHRRRASGAPAGLRRDAHHRRRRVGAPADRDEAIRVLRRCLDLEVNFIDTADSYGPHVSEELIAEALHPYPRELLIATKGGFERPGPGKWVTNGRPDYLRACVDGSLRRLRVERIDLWQLHRVDDKVPADEQFGAMAELVEAGEGALRRAVRGVGRRGRGRAARRARRHGAEPLQSGRA
jgi:aryl-alcohol dehydrogenase-like predicted oxidoreductase